MITSCRGRDLLGVWCATSFLFLLQVTFTLGYGIPEFLEFGECPDAVVKPDLDFNRYSGIWFNMESVPNEYTDVVRCSMTNYTWNGELMTVVERGLTEDGRKVRQNSLMRQTYDEEIGVLTVEAEGVPSAPYTVIATDYENYACVSSCMSFMGFRAAFSWIFARTPTPDHSYMALCRDIMAKQGVDPSPMEPIVQGKSCPYVDKLDGLLAYTESVQRKAKAKAEAKKKAQRTMTTTVPEEGASVPESPKATVDVERELINLLEENEERMEEMEREMNENEEKLQTVLETEQEERTTLEHLERELEEEKRQINQERRHRHRFEKTVTPSPGSAVSLQVGGVTFLMTSLVLLASYC